MASRSDQDGRLASIASMKRSQGLMQQTLAAGNVPVDKEVEIRYMLADACVKSARQLQHEQFIHDAVEHLEVIRRKAPQTSADYSKYLGLLCRARTSQYLMVDSPHALDMAVEAGRAALESSAASSLEASDQDAYLAIIGELSYALSRRHALANALDDLDEAIRYSRMAYQGSLEDSDRHFMSLNNLVSQIRRRIEQVYDEEMAREAETLLNELMTSTTPGTKHHAFAAGQFGFIQAQKFKSTGSLADLNTAIEHCRIALKALPPHHENRPDVLTVLVDLYSQGRPLRNEASDLSRLVRYSSQLFNALPSEGSKREAYAYRHAELLKEYVKDDPSPERVGHALKQLYALLAILSIASLSPRQKCQVIILDILGIQYTMSWSMNDLLTLLAYTEVTLSSKDHLFHQEELELTSPDLVSLIDKVWIFKSYVAIVADAPIDNYLRNLAQQELAGLFLSHSGPEKPVIAMVKIVCHSYGARLYVMANAIKARSVPSEEDIDRQTAAVLAAEARRQANMRPWTAVSRPPVEIHDARGGAFGSRTLGIDEETGSVMWSLNKDWLESALGYDPEEQSNLPKQQFIIRESRMEQLAIENARAEGRRPNPHLCRMCRDVAKPLRLAEDGYRLSAESIFLPFGNFDQLSCRAQCVICRLIVSTMTTKTGDLHPRLKAIDGEAQGTQLLSGVLSTGEHVLNIQYGLRHVGDMRLVTAENYHRCIRQAWEAPERASLLKAMDPSSHPTTTVQGQQVNPTLIKSWLDECYHGHSPSCGPQTLRASGEEMAMTFIDVIDACLVTSTSREKYFALSYVWGDVDMCKTTKANFQLRQERGALSDMAFPKTISDAIELVKAMGERHLWIDAICMAQDDAAQMGKDVPRMNIVYGQAFCTIVAMTGDNADSGLPGVLPGTRRPQYIGRLKVATQSSTLDECAEEDEDEGETICLAMTPRPLELESDIAKWNTRGWIFQERLLSRRCLYFSQNAVYFQCAKHTLSEYGPNEDYTPLFLGKTPQRPRPVSKRAARDNALDQLPSGQSSRAAEAVQVGVIFRVYTDLVRSYSRREFTFRSDVIKGFAGIPPLLEEHFGSDTHVGLPGAVMTHALLWSPAGRIPRRGMRLPTPDDLNMGKPDMRFPSWSWAGWDGPVEYSLFGETDMLPVPIVSDYRLGGRPIPVEGTIHETETIDESSNTSVTETEVQAPDTEHVQPQSESNVSVAFPSERQPLSDFKEGDNSTDEDEKPEIHGTLRYQADPSRGTTWAVAPPQPGTVPWDPPIPANILSFVAPAVPVSMFSIASGKEYLIDSHYTHTQSSQAVRRIRNKQGNHCGLWWEQAGYGYVGLSMAADAESKIHMLGMSMHRDDTGQRLKRLRRVEGEIPLFDEGVFAATGSKSGLVNILVVDGKLESPDSVGYRVTVAVMHVKAWEAACPVNAEVRLS